MIGVEEEPIQVFISIRATLFCVLMNRLSKQNNDLDSAHFHVCLAHFFFLIYPFGHSEKLSLPFDLNN